jgi:hypothetical protein
MTEEEKVDFRLGKHDVTGRTMVEIWIGRQMVGCIYAQDPRSIRLISRWIDKETSIPSDLMGVSVKQFSFMPRGE